MNHICRGALNSLRVTHHLPLVFARSVLESCVPLLRGVKNGAGARSRGEVGNRSPSTGNTVLVTLNTMQISKLVDLILVQNAQLEHREAGARAERGRRRGGGGGGEGEGRLDGERVVISEEFSDGSDLTRVYSM